jgi:hypothetical protein
VVNAAVSRRDDTIDIIGNSSLVSHDGGSKPASFCWKPG